jgi:ABC-type branched-subunit amino acid transport system substrate-binding protein
VNSRARLCALSIGAIAILGACGSSSTSSTSGAGGSSSLSGTPVKLMVMYQFTGDPIAQHPEVGAGAQAAAQSINAGGGIANHPVQIVTCDLHDSPTGEQACAQQAVSQNVTAVVGSLFETGAQSIPMLQQAGIPIIGSLGVYTPPEFTNPDVWPLMGGAVTTYPAIPYLVAKAGKKSIAVANSPGSGLDQLIQAQASKAGLTYSGTVNVPLTATDYLPYANQVKGLSADVVVQVLSATGSAQIMKAGGQIGLTATWANQTLNIDDSNLSSFGSSADGMFITSSFPPASAGDQFPGIKAFNSEMDAAGKSGVQSTDIRGAQAVTSWLAVHAVANVAKGATGDITAAALVSALKNAQSVDVEGLVSWKPNAVGPSSFPRLTNSGVYLEKVVSGKLQLVSNTPVDYFSVAGLTS